MTTSNVQTTLNSTPQPSFQENDNSDTQSLLNAIDRLGPQTTPVILTIDLGSGSYSDFAANPPAGVTLILNGVSGSTTIVGQSQALTVASGGVVVENMMLTTSANAPTPPRPSPSPSAPPRSATPSVTIPKPTVGRPT